MGAPRMTWLCRLYRHRYVLLPAVGAWLCLRCGRTDARWAPDAKTAAIAFDFGLLG